jgi:hypothetical protein
MEGTHWAGCEDYHPECARTMADRALKAVPCICTPEYSQRQLEDPACFHHDLARELDVYDERPVIRDGTGRRVPYGP